MLDHPAASLPVVIVGGYLTEPGRYERLGIGLGRVSGCPVFVAPIGFADWLAASVRDDFSAMLRKLAGTVSAVRRQTGAEQVTLLGHSAGGILCRLFLGDQPYGPDALAFAGHRHVARLVTLGTPHRSIRSGRQAGLNKVQLVTRHYPGAFWPSLDYVTIAGNGIVGRRDGTIAERAAFASYTLFDGLGEQRGDGIVPLSCGLLDGARQLVLPDVHHGPRALRPWYGENETIIARWWEAVVDPACRAAEAAGY